MRAYGQERRARGGRRAGWGSLQARCRPVARVQSGQTTALRNLSDRSALHILSLHCPFVPRLSRDLGASSPDVSPWCLPTSARVGSPVTK